MAQIPKWWAKTLKGFQCSKVIDASLSLHLGKTSAEPWFAGLKARRVWSVPDFNSERWWGWFSRWELRSCHPPCWFHPVNYEIVWFSLVDSDLSLRNWLVVFGFFLSPMHTRGDVHRVLACEISYFWNGLLKAVGGFNYISSPAAAIVLQLWPLRAIPLLSMLNYSPWAVPKVSQSKRDTRN